MGAPGLSPPQSRMKVDEDGANQGTPQDAAKASGEQSGSFGASGEPGRWARPGDPTLSQSVAGQRAPGLPTHWDLRASRTGIVPPDPALELEVLLGLKELG